MEKIERELIELEEIANTEVINCANLIHVYKKLIPLWDAHEQKEEKIAEELIDVLFYVLDASRLACPNIDMDVMFLKKLKKNRRRKYQYGEGHRRGTQSCVKITKETEAKS